MYGNTANGEKQADGTVKKIAHSRPLIWAKAKKSLLIYKQL